MKLDDYLTLPVPRFLRASGLSRERFYKLVAASELESFMLGARRYVVIASYKALIERQRATEAQGAAPRRRAAIARTGPEPPAAA